MIRWPDQYHPSHAVLHLRNELSMSVPPEAVWAWLVRAELWPTWYVNSRNVRIEDGPRPDLALGTRFHWWTFGIPIQSTIAEFVPSERIAWIARGPGLCAYHAWLIQKTANGCHILTEETQFGSLPWLGKPFFIPKRIHHFHQVWLEQLQLKAISGLPPNKTQDS